MIRKRLNLNSESHWLISETLSCKSGKKHLPECMISLTYFLTPLYDHQIFSSFIFKSYRIDFFPKRG